MPQRFRVLSLEGIDAIIRALGDEGRVVIGPTRSNGVIGHDEIHTAEDLPHGWTEEQDAGRYRLVPTGDDRLFAHATPSESWKRFLFPARTLLIRAKRNGTDVAIEQPTPEARPVAFFGIRSCDLAALGILDRVFLDPDATDPTYASSRSDIFIVAASCATPGGTCFCASMNTGPSPREGFDLTVAELAGDEGLDYLVTAGTDAGASLLDQIDGRDSTSHDHERATASHANAVAHMGRHLDPADPPKAALDPNHPQWNDVAQRCLACANCTMACPTCFCSTTEDSTNLAGTEAERWRVWDSCFTLGFSHMHGGSTRSSTSSRYRQWALHKLVTWHDQFDISGCVGCGRCITWCPVGIDLTAEIAALARRAQDGSETEGERP